MPLQGLDKLAPFQHHLMFAGIFPSSHYDTRSLKSNKSITNLQINILKVTGITIH